MASSSSNQNRCFSEFAGENFPVSKILYDAFINHRGPDTKDTLAFALYDSLEEKGFCTFLDDQELQLGNSIQSAIHNAIYSSSVQIAIFSPRYAESSWCLDELLLMLQTKATFIPIFNDVKPSDVRYPDGGVYKDAFAKHEENGRFSKETLNDWKAALHSSSLIAGYEFNTSFDNVEILCSKIVLAVKRKVENRSKGFPRYVEVAKLQKASAPAKNSGLLLRDSHPVGMHSKVEEIEALLENPEHQIIAVVGMGGSGKTFLLQNVYNTLRSGYDHSIWLSISKLYSVKGLQHDIAFHLGLRREIVDGAVSDERAAEIIHGRLEGKKSLIVLDDLWDLSTEDDLLDKLGLTAQKDCKVVMTTRNKGVAEKLEATIYEMKNLSDKDSLELFCIHAFPFWKENRAPSDLEDVSREIAKQCGNLPLAIKTTAASLANTYLLSKWKSKLYQLKKAAIPFDEHDRVMDILRLSYDSLPAHLKPCFAYLSFFPEYEKIDPEYLVYLWIAEGFIPAEAGEEQWDMARNWLDQLADLCLLHIREEQGNLADYHLTKYCTVHNLLHDLAKQISRQNKCAFSIEEASGKTSTSGLCRILLAKKSINDNVISAICPVYLRTLSLSQNRQIGRIPANLFNAMRGLRVLDLSNTGISALPESVGKMRLLKVLNLKYTHVREVPDCVRNLRSLLFLAMPEGKCIHLPEWISELKCLKHLEYQGVTHNAKGISELLSLRTPRSGGFNFEESVIIQLQELRLTVTHDMYMKRIERGILAHLVNMRVLKLINWSEIDSPLIPETMTAMKQLEVLTLESFAVPYWICDLVNLRELTFEDCECSDYPELQIMPNLVKLELKSNDLCRQLPKAYGKSGAFPNLRFFTMDKLHELEDFPELEKGAMACLEELRLLECPSVEKAEGLEQLKNLKLFSWEGSGTDTLWETLKEGGKYWNKIRAMNSTLAIINSGVITDM